MRIVVAPDSYKGCLTSAEVAQAMALGVRDAAAGAEVIELPVADGGEGTAEIVAVAIGAERVGCTAVDPLGRRIKTCYYRYGDTAVIDVAAASGLALLAPEERDPFIADSYGTGILLRHALRSGCKRFCIGLGGSATVDGGVGIARAFGVRFYDGSDRECSKLTDVARVEFPLEVQTLSGCELLLINDVEAPLIGPGGAAAVFGPQKGACTPQQVHVLDDALARLSRLTGFNPMSAGSGAAGGIGLMIEAIASRGGAVTRVLRGADFVLDAVGFDEVVANANLVLTGEGHSDAQTLMGKIPSVVLRRCQCAGIDVALLAGGIDNESDLYAAGFRIVSPIHSPDIVMEQAIRRDVTRCHLRQTACRVVGDFMRGQSAGRIFPVCNEVKNC